MRNLKSRIGYPFFRTRNGQAKILVVLVSLVVVSILGLALTREEAGGHRSRHRPNFLVIITDDQRVDTLNGDFMPHTQRLLLDRGVLFTNGFVTTPLCAPSRSSVLTGKYGRHNGVLTNGQLLRERTLFHRLHRAGYYTGHVGKFLNPWPGDPRPEYDYWVAHAGGASRYYDPRLNINGQWGIVKGYITYIFRDHALAFLNRVPADQPFILYFAPNAPHAPAEPAPGDETLYLDLDLHRPPNFNEEDVSEKPLWLQNRPPLNEKQIAASDDFRLRQLQVLRPVDLAIRDILTLLENQGKLDDTVIFFMGDNGFFWGEHRLTGKNRVYEEAQRVPFAFRYPRLVNGPRIENRFVANVDIAATIYELAGVRRPPDVDGLSFVDLFSGKRWRDALLFEGRPPQPYQALRTDRFVYVETVNDRSELYDLQNDPFQLDNLIDDPDYEDIADELRDRLNSGNF